MEPSMSTAKEPASVDLLRLLRTHERMIRGYAYALTRDFHLTDDIHQEVGVVVATGWETLPSGDGLVPWLLEVTRRKSLESLRRWGRRHQVELDEDVAQGLAESARLLVEDASVQRREHLSHCVEKLGGDARTIIEARYWQGKDCEQIALDLGRTVKSVYGVLARARIALAACVDQALGRGQGAR
jgi:RNA polymerase sigma-70 factor, ECF subfamily